MDTLITPATWIVSIIFGMAASYFANKRKWNPYLWFFIGFVFGIFGLITIFMIPRKKRGRKKGAPPKRAETPVPVLQGPSDKFWFYLDDTHSKVGPISYNAILKALHLGQISKTTYVWHENLAGWKKAEELIKN